jgi:hypothetical protein
VDDGVGALQVFEELEDGDGAGELGDVDGRLGRVDGFVVVDQVAELAGGDEAGEVAVIGDDGDTGPAHVGGAVENGRVDGAGFDGEEALGGGGDGGELDGDGGLGGDASGHDG